MHTFFTVLGYNELFKYKNTKHADQIIIHKLLINRSIII